MEISVVIAVYNGIDFIEKAIKSCNYFEIVKEIILIDDGSKDGSLKRAIALKDGFPKLKVFQHKGGINKGAGASWNLGIKKASCEWIAILGVDDVFLENRFDKEIELYKQKDDFDGIYGAMGSHFFSEKAKEQFYKVFNREITTIKEKIDPLELNFLLLQMLKNKSGYFSLNSLTIRKSLLEKVGLVNEKLRLHQDTDLIIKLSTKGKLVPGIIESPISSRGVHENNRITSSTYGFSSRLLMYQELLAWFENNFKDEKIIYKLKLDILAYKFLTENKKYSLTKALKYTFKYAALFYNDRYFNLLVKNANSSTKIKDFIIRAKEKFVLVFLHKKVKQLSIYKN